MFSLGWWIAPKGVVEYEYVGPSESELDSYFLSKAQDTCKDAGGDWLKEGDDWFGGKSAEDGCVLDGKGHAYRNHSLHGFDDYLALRDAKKVCEKHKGKWGKMGYLINYRGQELCDLNGKNYLFSKEDGRLIFTPPLEELQ